MDHPNLPEDKIPYWDFDAPEIPHTLRGMLLRSDHGFCFHRTKSLDNNRIRKRRRLKLAEHNSVPFLSPDYLAEVGTNNNFVLLHSTGHLPGNSEVDATANVC